MDVVNLVLSGPVKPCMGLYQAFALYCWHLNLIACMVPYIRARFVQGYLEEVIDRLRSLVRPPVSDLVVDNR